MRCIHGERNPSATVNVEEGAYTCFSCGLRGDAIAIIRAQDSCSFSEALVRYKEITGHDLAVRSDRPNTGRADAAESQSYESGGFLASRLRKGNR